MSNISTSQPTRGTMTPVYTKEGKPFVVKGITYPSFLGKLLSLLLLAILLGLPIFYATYSVTRPPVLAQPSISAVSNNINK